MSPRVKIEFVSDVVCPWCALGFATLQEALRQMDDVQVGVRVEPFELNPDAPATGPEIFAHLYRLTGMSREQFEHSQAVLHQRGKEVGFDFGAGVRHVHNTFAAHRLLHAAVQSGAQLQLQHQLFKAYFTDGLNVADRDVLLGAAINAGLSEAIVKAVLDSDQYAGEVREREHVWRQRGINGVPAFIFNERHLLQGAQPVEVLVNAIRQLAAQSA